MKINRALIGPRFKHVSLRFFCFLGSEKIHDLQSIAKIEKLSAENRKANRTHGRQQFSVSYWSAQPRQNITSGLPYTAHNPQLSRPHSRTDPPQIASTRTTTSAPTFSGLCFPACEPRRRELEMISARCPRE